MISQFKGNRSDYWNTPKNIYNEILRLGYKDYNPEGSFISPFNSDTNKYHNDKIFINPPFSILNKLEWILTIKELIENENQIILLVPARTDTVQFHVLLNLGFRVTFIKGRLKYNDEKTAPFPSLFMTYNTIINIKEN